VVCVRAILKVVNLLKLTALLKKVKPKASLFKEINMAGLKDLVNISRR
jgi:hypothetical protein